VVVMLSPREGGGGQISNTVIEPGTFLGTTISTLKQQVLFQHFRFLHTFFGGGAPKCLF